MNQIAQSIINFFIKFREDNISKGSVTDNANFKLYCVIFEILFLFLIYIFHFYLLNIMYS